jgi:hypothetical protein
LGKASASLGKGWTWSGARRRRRRKMMKSAIENAHTPPKAAPTTAARGIELPLGLADSDELGVDCDAPTAVGLGGDKWVWLEPPETKLGTG